VEITNKFRIASDAVTVSNVRSLINSSGGGMSVSCTAEPFVARGDNGWPQAAELLAHIPISCQF